MASRSLEDAVVPCYAAPVVRTRRPRDLDKATDVVHWRCVGVDKWEVVRRTGVERGGKGEKREGRGGGRKAKWGMMGGMMNVGEGLGQTKPSKSASLCCLHNT